MPMKFAKFWRGLVDKGYIHEPFHPRVAKELESHSDFAAAVGGDETAIQRLIDDGIQMEETLLESAPPDTGSESEKITRKRQREPRKMGEANHCGLLSGLVFRLAEIEEAECHQIVHRACAASIRRCLEDSLLPDHIDRELFVQRTFEVIQRYGLSSQYLEQGVDRLIELDHSESVPEYLEIATQELRNRILQTLRSSEVEFPASIFMELAGIDPRTSPSEPLGRYDLSRCVGSDLFLQFYRFGGFLHTLDLASRTLAVKYRWTPSQAIQFLLSHGRPTCYVARVEYDVRSDPTGLSRIVLTLDPSLTPEQVATMYSDARHKLAGNRKRLRPSSYSAANFVFTQTHTPVETMDDFRCLWEQWKDFEILQRTECGGTVQTYGRVQEFRRQATDARDETLNPKLHVPADRFEYPNLATLPDRAKRPRKSSKPPN